MAEPGVVEGKSHSNWPSRFSPFATQENFEAEATLASTVATLPDVTFRSSIAQRASHISSIQWWLDAQALPIAPFQLVITVSLLWGLVVRAGCARLELAQSPTCPCARQGAPGKCRVCLWHVG